MIYCTFDWSSGDGCSAQQCMPFRFYLMSPINKIHKIFHILIQIKCLCATLMLETRNLDVIYNDLFLSCGSNTRLLLSTPLKYFCYSRRQVCIYSYVRFHCCSKINVLLSKNVCLISAWFKSCGHKSC